MAGEGIVPQAPVPVQSAPAPLQVTPMQAPRPAVTGGGGVQSQPWYGPAAQNFQQAYNLFTPLSQQIAAQPGHFGGFATAVVQPPPQDTTPAQTPQQYGPPAPNSQGPWQQTADPQTASPGPYADTQPMPATFGPDGNMQEIPGATPQYQPFNNLDNPNLPGEAPTPFTNTGPPPSVDPTLVNPGAGWPAPGQGGLLPGSPVYDLQTPHGPINDSPVNPADYTTPDQYAQLGIPYGPGTASDVASGGVDSLAWTPDQAPLTSSDYASLDSMLGAGAGDGGDE